MPESSSTNNPGKQKGPKPKGLGGDGFYVVKDEGNASDERLHKEALELLETSDGAVVGPRSMDLDAVILPFVADKIFMEVWPEPSHVKPTVMSWVRDNGFRQERNGCRPPVPGQAVLTNLTAIKNKISGESKGLRSCQFVGVHVRAPKYPMRTLLTAPQARARYKEEMEALLAQTTELLALQALDSEEAVLEPSSPSKHKGPAEADAVRDEPPSKKLKPVNGSDTSSSSARLSYGALTSAEVWALPKIPKKAPLLPPPPASPPPPPPPAPTAPAQRSVPSSSSTAAPATPPAPATPAPSSFAQKLTAMKEKRAVEDAEYERKQAVYRERERIKAEEAMVAREQEVRRAPTLLEEDRGPWRISVPAPGYYSQPGAEEKDGVGFKVLMVGVSRDTDVQLSRSGLRPAHTVERASVLILGTKPGYTASQARHVRLVQQMRAKGWGDVVSHYWVRDCHAAGQVLPLARYRVDIAKK